MRAVNGCIIIFKWVWVILFKLSVNDWHFLGRYESSQETTIPFITSFLFITFAKFILFPQQNDVKNLLMCLFDCYFVCILSILWIIFFLSETDLACCKIVQEIPVRLWFGLFPWENLYAFRYIISIKFLTLN